MTVPVQMNVVADLRTAQNRMFSFIEEAVVQAEKEGTITELYKDDVKVSQLYFEVKNHILTLLGVSEGKKDQYHIGIVDSGKRAIESLVSYFCLPEPEVNVVVSTENYVAFNKFSAVAALKKQKDVDFGTPFNLEMGQALTVGSDAEFAKAKDLLRTNKIKTFWIAWNSTSTGVRERVEELVRYRNNCNSDALIISDAASLPLFTKFWQSIEDNILPDVFFFSMRKQGIPYDGPQDEVNQARNSGAVYFFNERSRKRANEIGGPSLYETPTPEEAASAIITSGDQRMNHIKHLLKLKVALHEFLDQNLDNLAAKDSVRQQIGVEIRKAFAKNGELAELGYTLLGDETVQSETTYIVKAPDNIKPTQVVNRLKNYGVHVSVSMHPHVPNSSYFRFACYPANSIDEARTALRSFAQCISAN